MGIKSLVFCSHFPEEDWTFRLVKQPSKRHLKPIGSGALVLSLHTSQGSQREAFL